MLIEHSNPFLVDDIGETIEEGFGLFRDLRVELVFADESDVLVSILDSDGDVCTSGNEIDGLGYPKFSLSVPYSF